MNGQPNNPEPHAIRIVEDRWTTLRHVIEAVAIVAAGVWAFYTFIYQEDIKPANQPASLDVSVSVTRLGRDARREILDATIHLRNSGKTEIDIAADALSVWGERFADRQRAVEKDRSNGRLYRFADPRISRRFIDGFAELRDAAVGGNAGAHIILEPDVSEVFGDVIVIPRGAYDLIHAQVVAVPVKTSIGRKVRITITRDERRGFWLEPHDTDPEIDEDDNETDFALIP